jgi:hypothetical protein
MPKRSYSAAAYQFGFNGMLAVNELRGVGNHYTAEYWEMDARIGRRWNRDPVVKEWESPYAVFSNNPIRYVDPSGADAQESEAPKGWKPSTSSTPEVFGKAPSPLRQATNFLASLFKNVITPAAILVGGAMNAHASNVSLGLHERIDPVMFGAQSNAFSYGQTVGDIYSLIQGAIEFEAGMTAIGGGVTGGILAVPVSGGSSVVAGGAVAVSGVVVAGHGIAMGAVATSNIIDDISRRSHDSVHDSGGGGQATKPTPEKNPKEFKRLPSEQGWINLKTGETYKKSHTSHRNPGNTGTQWKVWPKGTKYFGNDSKKSGVRKTLDADGNVIGD